MILSTQSSHLHPGGAYIGSRHSGGQFVVHNHVLTSVQSGVQLTSQ